MTKEFVFPLDVDDLVSLPITKDQVEAHIERLDGPALESLLNPVVVTPFVKEFMGWHIRSGHIPFPKMFSLCENGYLPKCFLALKKEKLVCPSCVFGKAKRRAWRTKSKPGSLTSSHADTPGACVSINHIASAQPDLVPQMDGRHTRDRISGSCFFLDHSSRYCMLYYLILAKN